MKEYIFGFQVPMNYFIVMNVLKSVADLFDNRLDLYFREYALAT